MSKRKRANHLDEDSYQQLKTHVGPKEISCNSAVHMNAVYERTLKLLADGSRHAVNNTSDAAVSDDHSGYETRMQPLPSNQLQIGCDGKLVLSRCRDLTSCREMDVEKHISELSSDACKQPAVVASCCRCQRQLSSTVADHARCSWCEKLICAQCLCQCCLCGLWFCRLCSISNYDSNSERTFCLQCAR